MQVEAIYNHGKLEFITPVKLRHDTLRVVVEVPDDEIEPRESPYDLPQEVVARACAMREKLDAIRNAPLPDDEVPDLTDKQQQRLDAFALQEDR
ncbi:MAG: hypothetical protein KFB96_07210 [Thiocapsa sp.]|uniref:hypothetical protein n=1 Tax=Thiocapsa sp. TaxID=2024551 RepID=UPI001BCAC67D|nr:hypothetical protein [Thiocapsa sp.]QVL50229.1 MAG: hypothetical protein KFB96_07210 [Thiocapsa sp.]